MKDYIVGINVVMRLHYLARVLSLLGINSAKDWLNFSTEISLLRLSRKLENKQREK